MAALASTSFEINMVATEVKDYSSDISEEIDELAGDLDPIMEADEVNSEMPNNDKLVSFNSDNISNDKKKQEEEDEDDIYEIEKIVDHRTYRGSIQYMIKWKGYPDKHNSWVSKEHVFAEKKESEYWNNKEIEAKEKIKSLVDKHNINTSKSLKNQNQKSNRIKKNKDKYISKKKSFVELKTTKTKSKLLNSNKGVYKKGIGEADVNGNSSINNDNISLANYYTTPLQSSEDSEVGEANKIDDERQYEKEEMLKYDEDGDDDDEYDNFTPAAIAGSWEPFVQDVATIQQDPCTGTLIVFLNWKNGHRTSHTNKVTNVKCPQKMLEFYQRHVQFVATNHH